MSGSCSLANHIARFQGRTMFLLTCHRVQQIIPHKSGGLKMRRNAMTILLGGCAIVAAAVPVLAHHSFSAQYDDKKPIDFTGKVTKLEWANPHIYFYVDVMD